MKIWYVICVCSLLTACGSFLEESDRSLISKDEFFLEEKDAPFAVDAIYSHFGPNSFYSKYYWQITALASDIAYANVTNPDLAEFSNFTFTPSNKIIESIWTELYAGIQTCNFAINNIPNAPNTDEAKQSLIAEARFFRAFFYLDLVRFFGGVPLELKDNSSGIVTENLSRIPRDSVLRFISQELQEVSEQLPETAEGRPHKKTAQAYLVKAYTLLKEFPMAYLTSQKVLSPLILSRDYEDLFSINNSQGSEVLFKIAFNQQVKGPMNTEALPKQLLGKASIRPSQNLINAFNNQDRRLHTTVRDIDGEIYVTKYWDQEHEPTGGETANDIPLLRLTDIMLNHAEIINEVRRSTNTEAINLVNTVRARARFDGSVDLNILPDIRPANYEQSLEFLLMERKRELSFEGYRWFDLVRTGQLEKIVKEAKPDVQVDSKHYRFPIPKRELDLNPNLTQNPGY